MAGRWATTWGAVAVVIAIPGAILALLQLQDRGEDEQKSGSRNSATASPLENRANPVPPVTNTQVAPGGRTYTVEIEEDPNRPDANTFRPYEFETSGDAPVTFLNRTSEACILVASMFEGLPAGMDAQRIPSGGKLVITFPLNTSASFRPYRYRCDGKQGGGGLTVTRPDEG